MTPYNVNTSDACPLEKPKSTMFFDKNACSMPSPVMKMNIAMSAANMILGTPIQVFSLTLLLEVSKLIPPFMINHLLT